MGVLVTLVLAAALSACEDESGPSDGDESKALYAVGPKHVVCTPSDGQSAFTQGFDIFNNRGPGQVTIDQVDWPTTGDLKVDSIRVFQRQDGDNFADVGIWGGLPEDGLRGSAKKTKPRGVVGFEVVLGALLAALDGGVITIIHVLVEHSHGLLG